MTQGPNVKKLIVTKMSSIAIPAGGGFADGIEFLKSSERIAAAAREATEWVTTALAAVRAAGDRRTDEEIAGAILTRIEARKRGK